jgi:hypothetical protein
VTDPFADVIKQPPTPQEAGFVEQVIQHTSGVYLASRNGLAIKPEGMRKDIGSFFSLPVPKAVWEKGEILQDKDFVAFVEQCFSDPR